MLRRRIVEGTALGNCLRVLVVTEAEVRVVKSHCHASWLRYACFLTVEQAKAHHCVFGHLRLFIVLFVRCDLLAEHYLVLGVARR